MGARNCSSQRTRRKSRTRTATENSGKRTCWEKCSNCEETAHKSRKGEAQEEGEGGITQKKRKNTGGRRKEGSHERRRRNEERKKEERTNQGENKRERRREATLNMYRS